jgi:hypothetical protein
MGIVWCSDGRCVRMPAFLEATVVRPVSGPCDEREKTALHDSMTADLGRWMVGDVWWGERGIDGPAARLEIDYNRDTLAHLFTVTDMGYVITHARVQYRKDDG